MLPKTASVKNEVAKLFPFGAVYNDRRKDGTRRLKFQHKQWGSVPDTNNSSRRVATVAALRAVFRKLGWKADCYFQPMNSYAARMRGQTHHLVVVVGVKPGTAVAPKRAVAQIKPFVLPPAMVAAKSAKVNTGAPQALVDSVAKWCKCSKRDARDMLESLRA